MESLPKKVCSVEACGRQAVARGYCSTHYSRFQAHGYVPDYPIGSYTHTEAQKAKIAEASKALWRNPEHKEHVTKALTGKAKPKSFKVAQSELNAQDYSYLNALSIADMAYIAGLVDGEGWIGIVKRGGRSNYIVVVSLSNTYKEVIDWLVSKLRGHARGVNRNIPAHYKAQWKWTVTQTHAEAILQAIEPYLIIKKEQARLALSFMRYRFDDISVQEDFAAQMKLLNCKGKPRPVNKAKT